MRGEERRARSAREASDKRHGAREGARRGEAANFCACGILLLEPRPVCAHAGILLLEPLLVVCLGGAVGFIVIALFLPLVKLITNVSDTANS